jgi:hypothetical protein
VSKKFERVVRKFLKFFLGIVPSIYDVATVGRNVSKGEGVSPQRICCDGSRTLFLNK